MKKKTPKTKKVLLTPLPQLEKKAQEVFNAWIRARDAGKPCISCGSWKANQAGHYISVAQSKYLRFDERNVHLQCTYCNLHHHGNQVNYRINLRKVLGEFDLEALERDHIDNRVKKWSREELNEIIEKYSL